MRRLRVLLAAVIMAAATSAMAATFPDRPITLVLGYAPGGGTDIFARLVAAKMSEILGQAIVVENKPGANAAIAGADVARAAPDGYTLLFVVNSHFTNPGIIANMGYDPLASFAPVGLVVGAPDVLFVRPGLAVSTLGELIQLAKTRPGELIAASPGLGSPADLVFNLIKTNAKLNVKTVPYRGSLPAINDVIAGHADLQMANIAESMTFVQSGQVKLLAQTGKTRSPLAPDVPTIAEANVPGLEDFSAITWFALLAPANTKPDVIMTLNGVLNQALTMPELRMRLGDLGAQPLGGSPEKAADYMRTEQARWLQVMQDMGIKPK